MLHDVSQEHFENEVYHQALVMSFQDRTQLRNHVQAFLTRFTGQAQRSAELDREHLQTAAPTDAGEPADDPSRGVWPRIETSETVETDSRGRLKTRRRHHLVLSNQTGGPVRDVRYEFQLEPDQIFDVRPAEDRRIPTMPPGGEMRFPLLFVMASQSQAQCVVHWADPAGEHVTEATVSV